MLYSNSKQYAEILVNGKTGITYRFNTIHKRLDLAASPSGNPNGILLCGFGKSLNKVIHVRSLRKTYENYRYEFFPKLLDSPNVLPEDKQKIRELLKKPWNPYIRRHSALTCSRLAGTISLPAVAASGAQPITFHFH